MIDRQGDGAEMTAVEIADVIWLTLLRESFNYSVNAVVNPEAPIRSSSVSLIDDLVENHLDNQSKDTVITGNAAGETEEAENPVAGLVSGRSKVADAVMNGVPFKVNNPRSIRDPLAMMRALKALMRSVPSGEIEGLDEEATARQIAEMGLWQPIVRPKLEPWLDVVLVADESDSMLMWQQNVLEFRNLLRNYGAFRDVQLWGMQCLGEEKASRVVLHPGIGRELKAQVACAPEELLDPSGRRLILVVTDCVARHWRSQALVDVMALWGRSSPMAIVQVLPRSMWVRTAVRGYETVVVKSSEAGAANGRFGVDWSAGWGDSTGEVCVPIVPMEGSAAMKRWSEMVIGLGASAAYELRSFEGFDAEGLSEDETPQGKLERSRVGMSPIARRLLGLLAATPVITLPVIRLVQETMLRQSRQMNVAEVLLCELLEAVEVPTLEMGPDQVEYGFKDEAVRGLILADMPLTDTVRVLTDYVARGFGGASLESFVAELRAWGEGEDAGLKAKARPFALVTAAVLKRKGGKYREWAEALEGRYEVAIEPPVVITAVAFPPLQEFEFDTVTIEPEPIFIESMVTGTMESLIDPQLAWGDRRFEFETATLEVVESIVETRRGWNPFAAKKAETRTEIVITKERGQAVGYVDRIDDQTSIAMITILGGLLLMGAPEEELESLSSERPQHLVTIPVFWMGQTQVTQAQWKAVAGMPQVNVGLDVDPSRSKGANLPVENVSWDDAIEFCARLSVATGREYRLPSEAEWEYACRAGTTGPFSFGETIDAEVANYRAQAEKKYNWSGKYGRGVLGKYREKTTPVGTFPANPFGLYDMHGNVWEWCEDHWHGDYQGAPIDGSAWLTNGSDADAARVLRGGSWLLYPWRCRSAFRLDYAAGTRDISLGFRVVVSALPRISS
jgi:formylglycine-generating enzyme required for sulfatase activity